MSLERILSELLRPLGPFRTPLKRGYQSAFCLGRCLLGRFSPMRCSVPCELLPPGTFFGYYDKCPWSPDGQSMIYHRIEGEEAVVEMNRPADRSVKSLGRTRAFSRQQGAMLQWLDNERILYNTIENNRYIARIVSRECNLLANLGRPVYCVQHGRNRGLSVDFERLYALAPGYGYPPLGAVETPAAPDVDGIRLVDFDSGEDVLLISIRRLASHEEVGSMKAARHYVNHLEFNPSATRFVFLHRWRGRAIEYTRMYTSDDSGNLFLLCDTGMVSHFTWLNNRELLAWARVDGREGYYIFKDETRDVRPFRPRALRRDGHPSVFPDNQWIALDTYPDRFRMQHLSLIKLSMQAAVHLASFYQPFRFEGPERCDLHPRWNRSGDRIAVDTVFTGHRRLAVLDLSSVVR